MLLCQQEGTPVLCGKCSREYCQILQFFRNLFETRHQSSELTDVGYGNHSHLSLQRLQRSNAQIYR